MDNEEKFYYIVVEEWLYPDESGREVCEDWDNLDDALKQAYELAEAEEANNFEKKTKTDSLPATLTIEFKDGKKVPTGYIVSPKNGLDQWFYKTKVIKVKRDY